MNRLSHILLNFFLLLPIFNAETDYNPLFLFHIVSSVGRNCTAVVINEKTLLTVASCISEPITVYAASFEKYNIKYIIRHPEFHYNELPDKFPMSDLAIIKLGGVITGTYRALIMEDWGRNIFNKRINNCEVAYWHSEIESIHKDIRRIAIKHFLVGQRSEYKNILSPYMDRDIKNVYEKYIFSYGQCEEDLKPLMRNSLPLICDGKLYGFFLRSMTFQSDVDMLFWSRVSGYKDWIREVLDADNVKIISDQDSYEKYLPYALEANVIPKDYGDYEFKTEEASYEDLSDSELEGLMKQAQDTEDNPSEWSNYQVGKYRVLSPKDLQTLRGQNHESMKKYIRGDPRCIFNHIPNPFGWLPKWLNPFSSLPWWLTPWGWADFFYELLPTFPWQIIPTVPPGLLEFTWPSWDTIFDALWYTTTTMTPCPRYLCYDFLTIPPGGIFLFMGIILSVLVISSLAMLTF